MQQFLQNPESFTTSEPRAKEEPKEKVKQTVYRDIDRPKTKCPKCLNRAEIKASEIKSFENNCHLLKNLP